MTGSSDIDRSKEEEEEYNKVLSLLPIKFRNELIFSAICQNGKMVSVQKSRREELAIPASAQEELDVKISLLFSIIKTLEELSGSVKVVESQYQRHDLVILGLATDKCLYTLSLPNSSEKIAKFLVNLIL